MEKLKIKNGKKLKAALGLTIVLTTMSLTGCGEDVYVPDAEEKYDILDLEDRYLKQTLTVPEEDFKLVIEYVPGEEVEKWTVTDNKELYTKVYTEGLPADTKVWIDNVHTDISLIATRGTMNGITQDSMDDRIHNSLMYGFPISDTTTFFGDTKIEGENSTFITGSSYGFNGYNSGSITERRHSEKEYLEAGVYANKISSAYGLLIQKGDNEPYGKDVSADIAVLIDNEVTMIDDDGEKTTYIFERDGSCEEVKPKTKTKK